MLRRYLFEIVLTALILCGLIAVFYPACRIAGGKLLKINYCPSTRMLNQSIVSIQCVYG
ncbi:hypothetical protein M8494_09455 [Serratia ureilytica]